MTAMASSDRFQMAAVCRCTDNGNGNVRERVLVHSIRKGMGWGMKRTVNVFGVATLGGGLDVYRLNTCFVWVGY